MIRSLHPWYLLFFLLIPLLWTAAGRIRVLGRGRKTLALILRTMVFLFLIAALMEVELLKQGDRLTVFFVIDRSSSIPVEEQQFALAYVQDRLSAIPKNDHAGIIFFGKDAAIQENPGERIKLTDYQILINPEGTDIEAALGLAMAAYPEGTQKRIVLLTDGNQTQGNAEAAAARAKANRVDLQILPLEYTYTQEVMVEEVILPSFLREQEPFTVKIIAHAQEAGPAKLRLRENGKVVAEQEVQLNAGKNAFVIPRSLDSVGFYTYEASIEAQNDRRPANNRAQNYGIVKGAPKVLLLEGDKKEQAYLAAALLAEGMEIETRSPEQMPENLRELQIYDSILLSNVPAAELSRSKQKILEIAVRDFGIGLVMIGGPNSFGAGGYANTPVEAALPVTMDVKHRKIIPNGALVLIMHSCEFAQGNYWSQEISLAALDTLSRNDYMGFLRFPREAVDYWLFPLEKVGDKIRQRQLLQNLQTADIGDMPDFGTTMEMAYESLQKVNANLKHIIILSDGDPQRPTDELLQAIRKEKITISTVCISPHDLKVCVETMQSIAEAGGGTYYLADDSQNLPKIFIKEASTVRRNLIIEEPFTPEIAAHSEVIQGFESGFPKLNGYVIVSARPEAETVLLTQEKDPLLAHWRYGLGKSAAFTSDAKSRWANDWLNWSGFGKFWAQVTRWSLRSGLEENFQVQTTTEGDHVKVVIDALTPDGDFINQLQFKAAAIRPDFSDLRFDVKQTQPGRYEGAFSAKDPGSYSLSLTFEGPNNRQGQIAAGVAVPYSPEHNTTRQNDALIKRLAEIGGNPVLTPKDNVFLHNLEASAEARALWPWFVGLAMIFFFLDIAVRRVFFELTQLERQWQRIWRWISYPFTRRVLPVGPATESLGQLMKAKARAVEEESASLEAKERLLQSLDQIQEETIAAALTDQKKSESPIWHELKPDESPQEFVDEEQDQYTNALFRAKQRAAERIKEKNK